MSLFLDFYADDLDPSTGASGLYAVVHGPKDNGKALKHSGGVFSMQDYLKSGHAGFAIPLVQHQERTDYFRYNIPAGAGLDMPAVSYGEEYIYEVWESPGTGGYNRDTDTLKGHRRIKWDGSRMVDAMLGKNQEVHVAYAGAAYVASTSFIKITAWLEKSGRVVTNPQSCRFILVNRSEATLADETDSSPDANGHFFLGTGISTLGADDSIKFTVEITDADGEKHKSGGTLSTWD